MTENIFARLVELAKEKRNKKKGKAVPMSVTERRGKTPDIKISSTDGLPAGQIVTRDKQAGQPSSSTGFATGDASRQGE